MLLEFASSAGFVQQLAHRLDIALQGCHIGSAREALEGHDVRDTGDYAEVLVAEALKAWRNTSGVMKGFDVLCDARGKIEVRSRTLPRDGRNEDRLEIPEAKVKQKNTDIKGITVFMLFMDWAMALFSLFSF